MYPEPTLVEFDGRTLTVEDAGTPGGFPVLVHRAAAREKFRTDGAEMYGRLSTPDGWLRLWGDRAGTDAAHSREAARYQASVFQDGWTHGDDGWWDDWSAFLSPWGFDLDAVTAPASLWHGLADTRCPPAHGRWLAGRIPHCIARFPEAEDHTNIEENNRGAGYTLASRPGPVMATAGRGRASVLQARSG